MMHQQTRTAAGRLAIPTLITLRQATGPVHALMHKGIIMSIGLAASPMKNDHMAYGIFMYEYAPRSPASEIDSCTRAASHRHSAT